MIRIWALVKKELLEVLFRGNPWREAFNIAAIFALLGVVLPLQWGTSWVDSPFVIFTWTGLPLMLVSSAVLDSFAGERERGTLETLLASCLSDLEILLGKIIAAVIYGWTIALMIIPVSLVTVNAVYHKTGTPWLLFPLNQFLLILVFSFLATWLMALVGVLISLRASTVRQAAQNLSLIMLASLSLPALVVFLLPRAGVLALFQILSKPNEVLVGGAILGFIILDVSIFIFSFLRFQRHQLLLD